MGEFRNKQLNFLFRLRILTPESRSPHLEHLSQVHSLNVSSTSLPPTTMSNPGPSTSGRSDPGPSTSGDGNPKKPSYFSLSQKTLPELKKMCKDAKLPRTGNKDQLMARIIDGGSGQTAQKKGGKGQKSARKEAVNQLFRDAGVDPNKVNKCLKAGVLNGHVPLTEEGTINLDQVLLKSGCNCCSKELTCTIRD